MCFSAVNPYCKRSQYVAYRGRWVGCLGATIELHGYHLFVGLIDAHTREELQWPIPLKLPVVCER